MDWSKIMSYKNIKRKDAFAEYQTERDEIVNDIAMSNAEKTHLLSELDQNFTKNIDADKVNPFKDFTPAGIHREVSLDGDRDYVNDLSETYIQTQDLLQLKTGTKEDRVKLDALYENFEKTSGPKFSKEFLEKRRRRLESETQDEQQINMDGYEYE